MNSSGLNGGSDCLVEAAVLLLRSPRWSVTDVLELLEIGDREFHALVRADRRLARVLEARAAGTGVTMVERSCVVCGDAYVTATHRDHCCSSACARISRMRRRH
ncbi:MAG TPA: hypothetical protein DCR65_09150 [Gammaproteobacteria bacterium]|jgi:hypothetical protein|nr:hypothetical protein [Gammaproteobacteria bacterium]